jgi:eukaryotic-like serine/threonine-protein kinase
VLEQNPAAGEEVQRGSTVTITVAEEPPPVRVPDVVDETEDDARAELEDAGFVVRVRDEAVTDETQDGVVLEQNPAGDEERPEGSRVTIVVGRFEEPPPVPTPEPTAEPGL